MKMPRHRRFDTLLATAVLVVCLPFVGSTEEVKPAIQEALDAADTVRAIDLLQAEIEIDPGYHLNYNYLGNIYYERQQYAKARDFFQSAVDKKAKHWESLYHLGRCQLALGDLEAAEKTMKVGLKKARNSEKGWFENGQGLVFMAREMYVDADRSFRNALVIDPDNPEYHINLGDANYYQGIPSLAISEYEKSLEVDTASLEVYYHWAEACLEMKDYNCAIEKLQVVLQKDSTHAPAWMRAGGIYFKAAMSTSGFADRKERLLETIGAYQRYLELSQATPDSSNVRVFFELAISYVSMGSGGAEDAVKYFEDVLSIPYEARDIFFQYGKALWGIQDYEKSGEALEKHLEWLKNPDNAEATRVGESELYQYLGDAYYYRENKDFNKCIEYYTLSLADNDRQERVTYNLAYSYHKLERLGPALAAYQKRIELGIDSTKVGVYKNAGYCALGIADNDAAEEEESLEEDEDDIGASSGIDPNVDYLEIGLGYLEQYLEFKPDDIKTIQLVAYSYLNKMADCTKGVQFYQRVLELEPNNCDAKKALGYAYFGGLCTKNYTKALSYLLDAQRCIEAADGACADVDLILWIAQCYHSQAIDKTNEKVAASEDFQKANKWYVKCLSCEPGNAVCKEGRDDTSFEF